MFIIYKVLCITESSSIIQLSVKRFFEDFWCPFPFQQKIAGAEKSPQFVMTLNAILDTEILSTHTPELFQKAVRRAAKLLCAGEVVALPTETVYGLAANALDEKI